REMTTAVFGHAEGHLEPGKPLMVLPEIHRVASESERGSQPGLVLRGAQAADLGRSFRRRGIECTRGEIEGPSAGVGELLVLAEPRLEGANSQCKLCVVGTRGGQGDEMPEGDLSASEGEFPGRGGRRFP